MSCESEGVGEGSVDFVPVLNHALHALDFASEHRTPMHVRRFPVEKDVQGLQCTSKAFIDGSLICLAPTPSYNINIQVFFAAPVWLKGPECGSFEI